MAPLSLELGIAGSVAPGQRVSGDLEVVHYYDRGGGVLGYGDLPALHASAIPLRPGDTLIFATDGINRHFSEGLAFGAPAQPLADYVMAHHCQRKDDALVVVARAS